MTTLERMQARGETLAKALNLRKAKRPDGKPYDPPRYQLGKEHGTKTAVGVFRTVQRLWDPNEMDISEDTKT